MEFRDLPERWRGEPRASKFHRREGFRPGRHEELVGAHHFGFIVEDIAETQQKVEAAGGTFFMDLGDNAEKENFERKFRDPDGIIIDISRKGWAGSKANP